MSGVVPAHDDLADLLSEVWLDQGRIGFLLSDPGGGHGEIRYAHDPVSQVGFRFRWLPHRELRTDVAELEARGILDPERDESLLFRDPRDPSGQFCFLCPENVRECNPQERLVSMHLAGRQFYAGANFAWISREHFTVMDARHVDQEFSDRTLEAMVDLHTQTAGRFRVIYNGAHAGATIPWHLHFQLTSEAFPIETLPIGHEHEYPAAVRRFAVDDGGASVLAHADAWRHLDREHHRLNVLVAGTVASPSVFLFFRDTRQSHAGAKGLIGGFEVCGDFVYSRPGTRDEFESASADLARSLLTETRPALA